MDISLILKTNYADKQWSIIGNPENELQYEEAVTWISKGNKPSWSSIVSQWDDVQYKTEYGAVSSARHTAYIAPNGSDAVFMKYQRGQATEQEWLDAVTAINEANPYPVAPTV